MESHSIADLHRRLEHLEKRGARWRWTSIACGLALAATVAAYAKSKDVAPNVIRASTFVVVNEAGREVIRIGSNPKEGGQGLIEILDKTGKPRARMGLTDSESSFHMLIGRDTRDLLILDAPVEGGVGMRLRNNKNDSGLLLTTSPEGIGAMGFMAPGGKLVLDVGADSDGACRLIIRDGDGKDWRPCSSKHWGEAQNVAKI